MPSREPPHDLVAERAVLGAILLNPDAWSKASEILPSDGSAFYDSKHVILWETFLDLRQKGKPIDEVTVAHALGKRKLEAGGIAYLSGLTDDIPTSANCEYYAGIVKAVSTRRALIAVWTRYAQLGFDYDTSLDALRESFMGEFSPLLYDGDTVEHNTMEHCVADSEARIQSIIDGRPAGIDTGWKSIDNILWGWEDLCLIAGRTGGGKTAWSMACAINAARAGKHVLYLSIEMSHPALGGRVASMLTGVDWKEVHTGKNKQWQLAQAHRAAQEAKALPLWVEDPARITVSKISARIERAIREHGGIDIVFVDYLQLCDADSTDKKDNKRYLELGQISQGFKAMTKTFHIPIVALCQLNRKAEDTTDPWDMKSQLRESGNLEQDADKIVVLVRYSQDQAQAMRKKNKCNTAYEKQINVAVVKHRNGMEGQTFLEFNRPRQTFHEIEFTAQKAESQANYDAKRGETKQEHQQESRPKQTAMMEPDAPFDDEDDGYMF